MSENGTATKKDVKDLTEIVIDGESLKSLLDMKAAENKAMDEVQFAQHAMQDLFMNLCRERKMSPREWALMSRGEDQVSLVKRGSQESTRGFQD